MLSDMSIIIYVRVAIKEAQLESCFKLQSNIQFKMNERYLQLEKEDYGRIHYQAEREFKSYENVNFLRIIIVWVIDFIFVINQCEYERSNPNYTI